MRAVVLTEHGANPALTEVPAPQPAAGEVLVRVQASSVNGFDISVAGALGLAGTAALDSLAVIAAQPGQTVLISGATGGVGGGIAVQFAAAAGARVIATARPGAEAEFVRGLGATDVVDYTGDLPAQVRALSPDGVDGVLHLAGDGATLAGLLAEKGRLGSPLGFGADQHPAAAFVLAQPTTETLDRLAADVAAGRIRVPVARTYTLTEVPTAFDHFTTGTLGKIAITVG